MIPGLRVDVRLPLHRFDLAAAFTMRAGRLGLFGPSGSGKTTILEVIAGLRRRVSGRVEFGGEVWLDAQRGIDRPARERGVGYVPQDGLLFPHWDVRGNIRAGKVRASRGAKVDPDRVVEVLDLSRLLGRRVETLSGGERQRVSLARALCSGPSLLLLDEPLGSVEKPLRGRILHYLLRVLEEFRIPALYVSHDATEVTILCKEVAVLREGRIVAGGRPADLFLGAPPLGDLEGPEHVNVLEGTITEAAAGRAVAAISGGSSLVLADAPEAALGARVLVGLRADDILLAVADTPGLSARNVIPGTIRRMHDLPGGWLVLVEVAADQPPVAVRVTEAARVAPGLKEGMHLRLIAKARSCRLLAVR